jgi:hypothetical protein
VLVGHLSRSLWVFSCRQLCCYLLCEVCCVFFPVHVVVWKVKSISGEKNPR